MSADGARIAINNTEYENLEFSKFTIDFLGELC
jgi:hypothetical protein